MLSLYGYYKLNCLVTFKSCGIVFLYANLFRNYKKHFPFSPAPIALYKYIYYMLGNAMFIRSYAVFVTLSLYDLKGFY